MRPFPFLFHGCLIALLGTSIPLRATDPVIVHEWGTFTCLQDGQGQAIGGINVDDEPAPGFVFQYANRLVQAQYSHAQESFGLPPYNFDGKGWSSGDPPSRCGSKRP